MYTPSVLSNMIISLNYLCVTYNEIEEYTLNKWLTFPMCVGARIPSILYFQVFVLDMHVVVQTHVLSYM